MTRNERDEGGGHADAGPAAAGKGARGEPQLRRMLQAAAARPEELPSPSPFLASRLRARVAEARAAGAAPQPLAAMGALAWRVVPALVLGLALLGVWTGFERARADRAADEEASSLVEPADIVGEAFVEERQESREEGQ